jgi:hypothetical protein
MLLQSTMTDVPRVKVRSIDFLSPEQLRRKREIDRKSQRQARERTRTYINELESKVHDFEARIRGLEQEFSAFVARCSCEDQQQPAGSVTQQPEQWQDSSKETDLSHEDQTQSVIRSANWMDQNCNLDLSQMMNDDPSGLGMHLAQSTRI